jgi:hypothetical protein
MPAALAAVRQRQTGGWFASRIEQLSEPGGYFDTDNLISNEKSYLHVVPALREAGFQGGAYIGVGPDQNFSYIAQVRPSIAFIVDIRRDNLLLHLLFKALFRLASTRIEYLSLLFGRPPPAMIDEWRPAPIERLIAYVDETPPSPDRASLHDRITAAVRMSGVPLSSAELQTIERFHTTFIEGGPQLKFETLGRAPRSYYPTYRELLLEGDRQGRRWNFLAAEDDFQFVRSLEQQNLVVPIIGDLAGPSALRAIGELMRQRGDRLSAFYTSNVEFYLFGDGKFGRFIDNLSRLPRNGRSLIIRSVFAPGGLGPSQALPGYASASSVQPADELVQGYAAGRFHAYAELARAR